MTRTTGSMLALVPGTRKAPGTGANTDHLVFFVGTHHPGWLRTARMPLFISDRRLRTYKTLPRAASTWALDSGGFTELSRYGTWDHGPAPGQYAARIRRYQDEIGHLAWAAPQDWMCEPAITARPASPSPNISGAPSTTSCGCGILIRACRSSRSCKAGPSATTFAAPTPTSTRVSTSRAEPLVGLGSVCRRQATTCIELIITALRACGITRLHGFGVKITGLTRCGPLLASADSLAWSYAARRQPPLPGCELRHINCANCPRYAARWYAHVRAELRKHAYTQLPLFDLPGGDT